MSKKTATILVGIIAVIGLFIALRFSGNDSVGSSTVCTDGYSCFTDLEVQGNFITDGDSTFSGGTVNITTANTATSTVVVGCIQSYATSTATALKQVFVTTGATSTYNGTVYWSYGTCPNL